MAVGQLNAVIQFVHTMARKRASNGMTDAELLQRFVLHRDEPAFESLVHRHGPMVLGVCRRVLHHAQDAEDAFQATFLVLVRKAASLRSPGTVANWLYGVANRTALEMRRAGALRKVKEAMVMPRSEPIPDPPADFRAVFDEELALLPDKFREAVVLCDLQSKSRRDAAQELSCAEGTVASRLARGRALLAKQLLRRGVGIAAGTLAASVLGESASAQVPGLLATATAKAAALLVAGHPLSSIASASVVAATEGVLKSMLLLKMKICASAIVILAAGLCTAGFLYGSSAAEAPYRRERDGSVVAEAATEADENPFVTGKVVDEQGAPVSGVHVKTKVPLQQPFVTTSDAEGSFRIALPDWRGSSRLLAEETNGRQGILILEEKGPKTGLRIKLQAARAVKVKVADAKSVPIAGAQVVLVLEDMYTTFSATTGADGTTTLRYPNEAKPAQVYAFKSGVGFDYVSTMIARRELARKPLPAEVSLKLTGARTVRVKAIDSANRPVPGIFVYPWYVLKAGMMEDAYTASFDLASVKTDSHGIAVFDWLPVDFSRAISFLCYSPEYGYTEQISIKQDAPVEELTTPLLRKAKISGKVFWPDGRLAAGIIVETSGTGPAVHPGNARVRTRVDGSYEMLVDSEEAYVVTVVDDRWAAASHVGVLLREGRPVTGIDFTLAEGTILSGTVTVGSDKRPAAGEYLSIRMSGGEIPKEIRKPNDRTGHEIRFFRNAVTDAEGKYRICLGPGKYQVVLLSMLGEPIDVTIGQDREIVQSFHMPRPEWGVLTGKVIDQNGQPVAGAAISGAYMRPTGKVAPEAISAGDGTFRVSRVQVPTVFFATTPDKKLAGIIRINADQDTLTIRVGPTAQAHGRLLDPEARVIAGGQVSFGIRVPSDEGRNTAYSYHFGGEVRSGPDGRYTIKGLVPGEEYELNNGYEPQTGRLLHLALVKPLKPETIELGDTLVPKPRLRRPKLE